MGSLGILGPECCYLLKQQAETSVVCTLLFLSLLLALAARGPTVCAWALPGLSDLPPAFLSLLGRDLREKHPPFTCRTWACSFADAFTAPRFACQRALWVRA